MSANFGSVGAERVKGAIGKPPVAPAGAKPPATKETKQHGSDRAEGFQRAIANFVCFYALWSRPQTRNPLRQAKSSSKLPKKSGATLPQTEA